MGINNFNGLSKFYINKQTYLFSIKQNTSLLAYNVYIVV